MKRLFLLTVIATSSFGQSNYDKYFFDKTMRFDFFHQGSHETENIVFDELIEEGRWAGSKVNLVDTINFGNYMLVVYDANTKTKIYSRGFSTLYQEWQTTNEAKLRERIFEGTVVFPYPKDSVVVEISRRDKENLFQVIYLTKVFPDNNFIRKDRNFKFDTFTIHESGDPSVKLDIAFIPDGYTEEEMDEFREDCNKFKEHLFYYSPFKENIDRINVWGVEAFSMDSGTDIPGENVWKSTVLNTTFYTFNSERYLMTYNYHNVRDVAANVPYDQIYIIVNTEKYGGGAIYNYYATTAAKNTKDRQIFIHEFGHSLAGLADEYGADDTYNDFYSKDVEPWEANITTLKDFNSKWAELVEEGVPIPTPDDSSFLNKNGVFEGAGYVNKGVYRSTYNSIMRAFTSDEFNEVSKQTLIKIINFYSN